MACRRIFFWLWVVAVALVLTTPRPALAYGRFGASDLMYIPTSGTLSQDAYGLYLNFSPGLTVLGGDLGLVPDLEIGATVVMGEGFEIASVRFKYHLLSEKKDGFGLAVGVQDAGSGDISPYVVAGKSLGYGLQGYLGFGGGVINGLFFGLNKTLRREGSYVFLEYDSYDLNLGGRFRLQGGLGLDVGVIDLQTITVGVSYLAKL